MQLDPHKTMVVFSGGQDSTTCLGWALCMFREVECVTFDYGQKHKIELGAARAVRDFFSERYRRNIPHHKVHLGPILLGSSPLTNPDEQLETYDSHEQMEEVIGERVEKTFVPMRNAIFLMIAANYAVARGCGSVVTGVCEADNANYPDCRQEFVAAARSTIIQALGINRDEFCIHTPLMRRTKKESILLARSLPHTYDALAHSHTAYDGQYPPIGRDHASVLRAHGFEQAGVPDPLVVRAWREGLMALPETANYDALR